MSLTADLPSVAYVTVQDDDVQTTATVTMRDESPSLQTVTGALEGTPSQYPIGPRRSERVVLVATSSLGTIFASSLVATLAEAIKKYYWHTTSRSGHCEINIEATEEQLGLVGDAIVSTSPWPAFWRQPEPESAVWRGVFTPPHHRKVLFAQEIDIETSKLPRLKPRITLDRRTLSRDKDE
jgi:hypothetical protein